MAAPTITSCIEGPGGLPVVAEAGLNTLQNINFNSGSNTCDLPASTTINGSAVAGIGVISSSSTTATAFSVTNTGIFTGTNIVTFTANSLTTGTLFTLSATGVVATTGTLLKYVATGLTTGTVEDFGTLAGLTTGIGIKIAHTTSVIADGGSLIQLSSSGIDTGGATNGTILDVLSSAQVAGTVVKIRGSAASATATKLLDIVQSGVTTGFTGNIVGITSASTTGTGSSLLITNVNTTAGNALKIVTNALTVGAGTGILVSHTTSVLGAGTSLVRISSTGVDTGTTTGTLFDLAQTAAVGNIAMLLTDSSADTAARTDVKISVSNAAAVGVIPLSILNVAVTGTGSKFIKLIQFSEGTKITTLWLSIDATTPNANLTGAVGDICFNGPSGRSFYNNNGTTGWTASNA